MNKIQWLIARASHCWQAGKDIPLRLHIELQNAGIDVGKLREEFFKLADLETN